MAMPDPDPEALARSAALAARIARDAAAAGGWIGFDAFMRRALYEPGLGYYAGPSRPFGPGGDFTTAPELSPLFARCVARQLSHWFASVEPVVVEFGAGTGRLAAGLLAALDELGTPARRYAIVELSGTLRERQRETIARLAPDALARVEWLDALPDAIRGVVVANEVLDAMPVKVFEHEDGRLDEIGVTPDGEGGFRWAARPAGDALRGALAEALRGAAPDVPDPFAALGPGRYRSEIGLEAGAWVGTVGRAIERGAMLLVDYGFPAREYYHPQRRDGTLVAHRRHRVHVDLLRWPGLQDLSAHVDFSAVARAAVAAGLAPLGYVSQARFLIGTGLLDELGGLARGPTTPETARALGAAQTLLSEAEMGELFKVAAFGRGVPDDAPAFARGDRSGSL